MPNDWIDKTVNENIIGPDHGIILFESELPGIAGITTEKKTNNIEEFYAVTVSIYNKLINTAYFHSKSDALEHTEAIKIILKVAYE